MGFNKKTIFTGLAPNVEWDDVWLSLKLFFQPWRWVSGPHIKKLEEEFASIHQTPYAISFPSGRAALQTSLSALHLPPDSEVLIQAFTCVAVPDAVRWAGLKPVYVDINPDTYNMSTEDARKKISSQTKAIIIQHTFGLSADLKSLLSLAKDHNLVVIEDVAHALGSSYDGKPVGSFGDAAIFSFGRDKVISSVFGGMLVTKSQNIAEKALKIRSEYVQEKRLWIARQLLYSTVMSLIMISYDFLNLGKIAMKSVLKSNFITPAVQPLNARQKKYDLLKKQFPNALAALALHQLSKLSRLTEHRQKIAWIYHQKLSSEKFIHPAYIEDKTHTYLRYTVRHPEAERILEEAKKEKILLGNWYDTPIAPFGVDFKEIDFDPETVPTARKVSEEIINLPTNIHIGNKQAERIVSFLNRI